MYEYKAVVTRVVNGDTVDCSIDLGFDVHINQRVRLLGVDASESRTTHPVEAEAGLKVKNWLTDKVTNQTVTLKTMYDNRGRFGRVLGTLYLAGNDINAFMLHAEMVKPYDGSKR